MGLQTLTVRVAGLGLLPPAARKIRLFESIVRRAFAQAKPLPQGEVAVVFLTRRKMRAMNRQFLGHDDDTDVIAFPHERIPGAARDWPLGDIFISADMAKRQAAEQGHSVLREALFLAAHGALHLLGHDDRSPRDRARMFRLQDELVGSLGRS